VAVAVIQATILDRAGDSLGGYLPRLGGALLLLLVGLVAAALIRRVLVKLLRAAGVDELGERWGVHDVLEGIGLARSLAMLVARAVRIAIVFVVVFAALSLLGLEFLSDSLNAAILFLPRVFVALALLIAGIVIGQLARRQVDRLAAQMDIPGPVGGLAETVIMGVFAITALAQLGIPTQVLLLLAAILIGAVALTLALAFGIGGRDMAREVSARRYVEGSYEIGEEVTVDGARGRIAAIEATGTVLDTGEGERVRIPNSQLVASVVTLHGEAPTDR
jgi:small-conductance mechanosensitive channel